MAESATQEMLQHGERLGRCLSYWLSLDHSGVVGAIRNNVERPTYLLCPGSVSKGEPTVWLLGWRGVEATPLHDHEDSEAVVGVYSGLVAETLFSLPVDYLEKAKDGTLVAVSEKRLISGGRLWVPAPYIHDVATGPGCEMCVTIHAYYPPLKSMNYFQVKAGCLCFDGHWDAEEVGGK